MNEVKYLLKGLDCANCAMKIEKQLNKLPEIETAVVDFATLKCVINYKTYSEEIEQKVIQCIIDTEDEVTVIKKNASHKHEEHHHEGECSCGHDHKEHHHDHHDHEEHHHEDGCNCGHEHHHEKQHEAHYLLKGILIARTVQSRLKAN